MKSVLLAFLIALGAQAHAPEVGFDPQVGTRVPDLAFREGRLGEHLGAVPVVLVLGYRGCVNLCGTTLEGVSFALRDTGLVPDRDYQALFVSVDPRDERAPQERRAGWHFLTGARAAATLAERVGWHYDYEADSGEFAHPAGFIVLTPQGEVARYFPGVRFEPSEVRAAIAQAALGRTQSRFERLLLVCFHDPVVGKHSAAVLMALRVAMAIFILALAFVGWRKLR